VEGNISNLANSTSSLFLSSLRSLKARGKEQEEKVEEREEEKEKEAGEEGKKEGETPRAIRLEVAANICSLVSRISHGGSLAAQTRS
jgi:hypothetical protein